MARHVVRSLDLNADGDFPSEEHARWMEEINKIATIAAAEQQAGMQGAPDAQGGGAPAPEGAAVEQPPMPGGVAERRNVA